MCIRDSLEVERTVPVGCFRRRQGSDVHVRLRRGRYADRILELRFGAAGTTSLWRVAPYRRQPLRGCLLYTSDAADERSNVDLGGRRIIEKKNTK